MAIAAAVYVAGHKGGDIMIAVAVVGLIARFYGRLVVSIAPSVETVSPVSDWHPATCSGKRTGSDTLKSGDRPGDCEYLRSGTERFHLVMIMAELQLWEQGADTVTGDSASGGSPQSPISVKSTMASSQRSSAVGTARTTSLCSPPATSSNAPS